jgi:hypothetical protein
MVMKLLTSKSLYFVKGGDASNGLAYNSPVLGFSVRGDVPGLCLYIPKTSDVATMFIPFGGADGVLNALALGVGTSATGNPPRDANNCIIY